MGVTEVVQVRDGGGVDVVAEDIEGNNEEIIKK